MKYFIHIICLVVINLKVNSQNWSVKISSNVELRTWKLSTKAEKEEHPLQGASIQLTQGSKLIYQGTSNNNGDFIVYVPGNGEYILTVSYPNCNAKKFLINTNGVPPNIQADNFKPSFSIGGFVMAKPFPGIDYSGLQQSLVRIIYEAKIKNFDDDEPFTEAGLGIVMKIAEAENKLINNFCNTNKAGDAALVKPDCPLAKQLYEKAIAMIPGESYPEIQLKKVGDCLKAKEEAEKSKIAAEKVKAAKEQEAKAKLAHEKALNAKQAKEKELAAKASATNAPKPNSTVNNKEKTPTVKPTTKEKITSDPKKKMSTITNTIEPTKPNVGIKSEGVNDKSDSKYRVQPVLGANKYKEALNKAEGFYKMKRYAEAKTAYEDVLKIKPGDSYATSKLTEVKKLLIK